MKQIKEQSLPGETRAAYAFNSPLILLTLAFVLLPVIGTVVTSLFQDVSFMERKFVLFANYARMLSDGHFWQSIRFTLLFVALSVTLELLLGMVFALLLNDVLPGRGFLRVALLIPWAIPIAISARIWELIYNFEFGLFNYLVAGIGAGPVNWLGTSTGALAALVVSDVWKTTPFMTIILLAGHSTIPEDLYQQARIDGTTALQRFFRITLPLVRPAMVVALLFRTIDAIRIFDLVYVLTGGGPGGSTTPLSLYAYKYYVSGDFGYGSAVSVAVFLVSFLLAILYVRVGRFTEAVS
jgi:multiple sugar transport system permease protein